MHNHETGTIITSLGTSRGSGWGWDTNSECVDEANNGYQKGVRGKKGGCETKTSPKTRGTISILFRRLC